MLLFIFCIRWRRYTCRRQRNICLFRYYFNKECTGYIKNISRELTLILLLDYDKVKRISKSLFNSENGTSYTESVEDKEKKLEQWESCIRRKIIRKNNLYLSDLSFYSGEYAVPICTIREQHLEMIQKAEQGKTN